MSRWSLFVVTVLVILIAILSTRTVMYNVGYLFPYTITVYNFNDSGKSVDFSVGNDTGRINYGGSTNIKVRNGNTLNAAHEGDTPLQYTFYSSFVSVLDSVYVFGDSIQPGNNVVHLKVTNSTENDLFIFIVGPDTLNSVSTVDSTKSVTFFTYAGRELAFSTSSTYFPTESFNYVTTLNADSIIVTSNGISTQ